ncbi:MAG: P-loop NTPase [Dehalococcoidales bacterium]|nr:P-loop NTPase [Dehalococcoidales bacterium]
MNKIAVCGKGGSGKSVVTRLLAGSLRNRGKRVVVIDSDESNTGLYRMLGFSQPPEPLIGLLGGKKKLEQMLEDSIRSGIPEMQVDLVRRELQLSDIPPEYMLEKDGIRLINIGKILMALEGCACPMGIVSRSFLKQLRLEPDEVAVIDMEAGVEHFGRGVETSIDCVLVVVEPSIDSLEVAEKIKELSGQINIADVWAVLNKVPSDDIAKYLTDSLEKKDIRVIGAIRQDAEIFQSSLEGRPFKGSVATEDVDKILDFLFP